MRFLAKVAAQHFGEVRIAFGGEDRDGVAGGPQKESGNPHPKTKTYGRRDGAVDDGKGPRGARQQDRLRQRAMQRHLEAFDHETSAPPPNEKNDRKKLEAANAMDRPSTI